jgi:AraC-like DNA-binding protein
MDPIAAPGSTFRFSTDAVPERDRLAVLREEVGRHFLRVDFEPSSDWPLRAQFAFQTLPGLRIVKAAQTPIAVRRMQTLIARDVDDFAFCISLAGHSSIVQRDREIASGAGDAYLLSCAEPVDCAPGTRRTIVLRVPRAALCALVPDVDDLVPHRISGHPEALRLLRGYLGALDDCCAMTTPALCQAVVSHIHELIALSITKTPDAAAPERSGVRAARLAAIKSDIPAQLSHPGLSAKTMARAHGVSDRYIHLLFAETGQTFSAFVEEQRMKRAFESLTDPARAAMRIGDIAAELGYAELSTFDRAFRRWFGDTPSGVRGRRSA